MLKEGIFQTAHHVCIIVRDIEKSIAYYESIGVGPWGSFPPLDVFKDIDVPDPSGFLNLTYRYANLANIQIQLCQPGDGATPQRKFLETHGEGVFHIGFKVADVDQAESEANA